MKGFSEGTTYYYNVTSCDASGNCNTAGTYTFTTQQTETTTGGGSTVSVIGGKSHMWTLLQPGAASVMKIEDEEYFVREVEISVKTESQDMKIHVIKQVGRPPSLPSPPGMAYGYVEIQGENLENLLGAKVRFEVSRGE